MRAVALLRRVTWQLLCAVSLLAVLAGVPAGLAAYVGWPLPHTVPAQDEFATLLTSPVSDTAIVNLLAVALWIVWAAFTYSVAVELLAALQGRQAPRLRLISPMQAAAAILVAGLTAGPVAATAAATAPVHAPSAIGPANPAATAAATALHTSSTPTARPHGTTSAGQTQAAGELAPDLILLRVGNTRHVHTVARGDNLSTIARAWLGDPDRWPEIYELNRGRHWPTGGTLTDPDLIYPGWTLDLPSDARPPAAATPPARAPTKPPTRPPAQSAPPPGPSSPAPDSSASTSPSPRPTPEPTRPATPTPDDSAAEQVPDGVIDPTTPPPGDTPTPQSTPETEADSDTDADEPSAPDQIDADRGVAVPGGWVGLGLAASVAAAGAMVWIHRRRRYIPGELAGPDLHDPDLQPLPPVVARLRHGVRHHAPHLLNVEPERHPTVSEYLAADVKPPLPPPGPSGPDLAGIAPYIGPRGLGLTGPGADAAARALLAATLSSGSPDDPPARGTAVIAGRVIATLLGAAAVTLGEIPRMHVAANPSDALTDIEELLIARRRMLNDYDAADLDALDAEHPFHETIPQILLLTETPPPELAARLATALQLGHPLHIVGVILGDWPTGDTLHVQSDGGTNTTTDSRTGPDARESAVPGHPRRDANRVAILDTPTTLDLLHVLREAHTGDRTDPTALSTEARADSNHPPTPHPGSGELAGPPAHGTPQPSTRKAEDEDQAAASATPPLEDPTAGSADMPRGGHSGGRDVDEPVSGARAEARPATSKVEVRVLGTPAVYTADGEPIGGLRSRAAELLVHLATRRNGVDIPDILDNLSPQAKNRRALERLSTDVANLRNRIRVAAGLDTVQPVVNTGGRYHLDPELLNIDWWTVLDAITEATNTQDPALRADALRRAVDAYHGPLADGCDYDWIEGAREASRRHGIIIHTKLAELIADTDPTEAARLYEAACDLDPVNDELARQSMRANAHAGNPDAIRVRLASIRDAVKDLDEYEPAEATVDLARKLLDDTASRPPRRRPPSSQHPET